MDRLRLSRRRLLAAASATIATAMAACAPARLAPTEPVVAPTAAQAEATRLPTQAAEATPVPTQASEPQGVVRIASGQEISEIEVRQKIVDLFNAQGGPTRAEVSIINGDRYEVQQTMIAGGNAPDILYLNVYFMYAFCAKKMLLPLDEYAAKDDSALSDVIPAALDAGRYEGELMCMPFELAPLVTFYNCALFDAAAVPYVTTDWEDVEWNWDSVVDVARSLTKEEDKQYGLVIDDWMWYNWVYQNGGRVMTDLKVVTPDTRCVINTPEVAEAIQWVVDLRNKHRVSCSGAAMQELSGWDRFPTGKVGMYPCSRWITTYREIDDFRWDVGALPSPRGKRPSTIMYALYYGAYAGSKNPQGAWDFLRFMLTEEPQTLNVSTGMACSSLDKVNRSPAFLESTPPEHEGVFADAMKYGFIEPANAATPACSGAIDAELGPVWAGTVGVAEGLEAAQEAGNNALEEWKTRNL